MATTVVEIWNMALSAAGSRALLASDADTTREANLCRLWYDLVRDGVQKAASWPSTKTYARLTKSATRASGDDTWDSADPAPKWTYAYAVPASMLAPRHLTNFARFELALWSGNPTIMTNQDEAILHYIKRQTDVSEWDVGLEQATIAALAAKIAVPLGANLGLKDRLFQEAEMHVTKAQTDLANESDDHWEAMPDFLEARGYAGMPRPDRYFYPYEQISGVLS